LQHRRTILHEDADFSTAAAIVTDIQQQRIPADNPDPAAPAHE